MRSIDGFAPLTQIIDTDFRRGPSDPDPNCQKMGESKRRVEGGGFEGGGGKVKK